MKLQELSKDTTESLYLQSGTQLLTILLHLQVLILLSAYGTLHNKNAQLPLKV